MSFSVKGDTSVIDRLKNKVDYVDNMLEETSPDDWDLPADSVIDVSEIGVGIYVEADSEGNSTSVALLFPLAGVAEPSTETLYQDPYTSWAGEHFKTSIGSYTSKNVEVIGNVAYAIEADVSELSDEHISGTLKRLEIEASNLAKDAASDSADSADEANDPYGSRGLSQGMFV